MLVLSPKYPSIRVHVGDANVKFRDGEADVSSAVAKRLVALPFGIEIAKAESVAESPETVTKRRPGRPRKTA